MAFEAVAMGMAVRFGMAALVQQELAALEDLLPGHWDHLDPCAVEWMTCEEGHVVEIHLEDLLRRFSEMSINVNFLISCSWLFY